jgi:hypothetical protein
MSENTSTYYEYLLSARTVVENNILPNLPAERRALSSQETYLNRYSICTYCEFLIGNKCLQCGCDMSRRVHLSWMKCPLQKWGEPDISGSFQPKCDDLLPLNINDFPEDIKLELLKFAKISLAHDGIFFYKNIQLITRVMDNEIKIYRSIVRDRRKMKFEQQATETSSLYLSAKQDAINSGSSFFDFNGTRIYLIFTESSSLKRVTPEKISTIQTGSSGFSLFPSSL